MREDSKMNDVWKPSADTTAPSPPAAEADHSRYVQRVRRVHGGRLDLLAAGPPGSGSIAELIDVLVGQGRALPAALRIARQLVMERLVVERHGELVGESGGPIDFWVVGMGKLGSRELNVSSDIDLIYVYEEEGESRGRADGRGVISAHEYFAQLSRRLQALIGDVTEDGFVFRMDLALRPNGNSGPPSVSLAMLEEYFLVQGREWERFAWLKSRRTAGAGQRRQALARGHP